MISSIYGVIAGRCADVVLRKYQPLRIFVYADVESKLGHVLAKLY